jgi:hypothetical protein
VALRLQVPGQEAQAALSARFDFAGVAKH